MTPAQRSALACRLAALAAAGTAVWMGVRGEWILPASLAWGAFLLLFLGGRFQSAHLSDRARHERAQRAMAADSKTLGAPIPCCSFWRHSGGQVHGPDCTRPAAAQHDGYRSDPSTAAAFEEITSRLGDGSAA